MKKADLLKMYKNHLTWLEKLAEKWNDKPRAVEQAYGYTLGISACNEKYYDEITEIWDAWYSKMIWGK